jgi:glucose/arabinose dehydrogenase
MGGDELNILNKGMNYGWPLTTYGVDYSGEIVSKATEMQGIKSPVIHWTPSIGVCSAEFVTGDLLKKWQNQLLVGALSFEEVRLLRIDGEKVSGQEVILKGVGRVRDLKVSPDGALYVLLNAPDMVLRITPDE